MFGWGKRKQAEARPATPSTAGDAGHPIIVALLLEGETYDIASLERALGKASFSGVKPGEFSADQGILMFQLGDETVAIAPMPAPYPWSELEGPCQTSWMWPKETPATTMQRHRTHMLVTAMAGSASPIERRLALTQVTALAAQQPGVIGIYWGEATLVHYPPVFIKMAQAITDPSAPPLYLWVDFRVFRNEDGTSGLFTTGLRALGQMEVEIPRIPMPPGELRDWAVNVAYYLLENGRKVKDGDTIGMTAEQQIRIRHTPSVFGHEGKVIQLQSA